MQNLVIIVFISKHTHYLILNETSMVITDGTVSTYDPLLDFLFNRAHNSQLSDNKPVN